MALPTSWVSALFKKMQARYGHKWVSAYEGILPQAIEEWGEVLGGLTGDQIKHGLESWQEDWPPSATEFKRVCLNEKPKVNEFGLDYVPQCYREEKRITDKSRLLSSDEREERRDGYRNHIGGLKEILK